MQSEKNASDVEKVKRIDFVIWTICLSNWRLCEPAKIQLIDITVKSGIEVFAPHRHDLYEYKNGRMTEDEYTSRYQEKMFYSRSEHKTIWDGLSVIPRAAFACYCGVGKYCHRHLFAPLAKEHLESMGWGVELRGEITKETLFENLPELPKDRIEREKKE